ncbi:interferon alpha-inducible protein 27-like protein 1 [Rhizophagus clarus]|uniref:Interferon alpha-inducible protein 27-like protein 1 n=1 Tax=Rhizophagus clarus TaxID=94130 RepID=A0A8H3KR75_9GLOM|nr:interferon alpha-inducible protein 27-like protein 1 [Rhizophagus clarus]
MPSNRTPFYSKLSDHDEVTIKISTDNQIYEKVSSDAYQPDEFSTYNTYKVYDATAEFPAENTITEFVKNHVALTIGAIVIFVLLISGVIPSLITFLINLIGFGVTGIAKGSYAALFMANYAGNVAVGSACAILQSAGALGVKGIGGLIKLLFKLFHLLIIYISHIITCWII